ncbi:MAG: outer membrane protein assembly factor BamA [Desulfuromonas sp.]|nr:MAG: outer membrane protein assembly factor BamA [Desulfuromonas sp.]
MFKKLVLMLCILCLAVVAAAADINVADITVSGNSRIESSSILAAIPFKPGDQITQVDLDNALRALFAMGRFDDVAIQLNDAAGGKVVNFVVRELPLVRRIAFTGNDKFDNKKLRPMVQMRVPSLYDRNKIEESIEAIKQAYIEDGYHAVKIEPIFIAGEKNEGTLTFNITEGEKVLIRDIDFVGNSVFDKGDLLDKMETKERWMFSWITGRGAYLAETMELDIERIKLAYRDVGYQDVKVKPAEVSLVGDEYIDIKIEIEEGPQYKTGIIKITGDLLKPEEELLPLVTLKTGDIFSRAQVRESILALTDFYANRGYAYVNVSPLTSKHAEELIYDLNLEVEQGLEVHVERIDISGNKKTRDKVIRREIPILEGGVYNAAAVKEANRRVRNLGYFDEVNVTTKPGSQEDQAIVDVEVMERPTGTFAIGAGYSTVDGVVGQGSVTQENFLGLGLQMNLSGTFGGSVTTYAIGLTDPYFMDTYWTLGFEVYKAEREFDEYDESRTGGAIKAGHPVTRYSKLYLTYRYEQKEISDVAETADILIQDAVGKSTLSSVTAEWVRNSTDNYQDPTRGGMTSVSLEYAGLGGTDNFLKGIASHRHFFPLFWGTVFSIHGEAGYIMETTGDDIPLSEKFFLGGIKTLRGFESREVGPIVDGSYVGGEKMAYFNFEYIFPISKSLGMKGVLFYDTGNAWSDDEEYFSEMRNSVGAGIRWLSPLGPLRFEWGYNLSPYEWEKNSVFEFNIGRAF